MVAAPSSRTPPPGLSEPRKRPRSPTSRRPSQVAVYSVDKSISDNHFKLLYLISLYATAANSTKQNERWMRHVPLLVLIFEGIISGTFDFDYAPASVNLSFGGKTLRRWINISREGKAAIDDLWEMELLNGLKLPSDDFQPITAYQMSMKGKAVLDRIPKFLCEKVENLVFPPSPKYERKLMQVHYDGTRFHLRSGEYSKVSEITESEDVSYVSSPFLPQCLRSNGPYRVEMRSNRSRAEECARGVSSISKSTTEAITLGHVHALVSEWVPFGSNQIVALNERMGALDRCQGGILTSYVDNAPTDTQFAVPLGQTQVRILDYDFVRFINFEAESHFPETTGIVQVEHFGMHLNSDGSLIYGILVDAIMDRKADDISIDHLSRLLVDVHQDSSMLVNDLLSRYQLSLLEMLYLGDSLQRNKYNCIMALHITPKLNHANDYLDNPNMANELAQVLGDLVAGYDLSTDDVLIVGKAGCLVSGPNIFRYERVLTTYVGLICRGIFIKNFFARTFVLDSTLKEIRTLIHSVQRDPATVLKVREKLAVVSKDTILLAETLEYLLDSLEDLQLVPKTSQSNVTSVNDTEIEARMMNILALNQLKTQTIMRCHDSIKLMENTMLQLEQLQMIADSMATNQLELACQRVHLNTRELMNTTVYQHTTRLTLEAMQYLVTGIFVFDVIDRLFGATFLNHIPKWAIDYFVNPLISYPFVWWILNLVIYGLGLIVIRYISAHFIEREPLGWCTVQTEVNQRISLEALHEFLSRRMIRVITTTQSPTAPAKGQSHHSRFRLVVWEETQWKGGACPALLVEIYYDEKQSFLLSLTLRFDTKKTTLREDECLQSIHDLLTHAGVYTIS